MEIDKYYIFHISDLHLGKGHAETYTNGSEKKIYKSSKIGNPISQLIFQQLPKNKKERTSTIVICSGDLANKNQPNDFKKAFQFLNQFTKDYDIPREQILLVPGNHDVYWKDYKPSDESAMMNLFINRFKFFPNPFRQKDGPCYYFPKHRLLVYCLNSCVLSGSMEYAPKMDDLLKKLPKYKKPIKKLLVDLLRIEPGFIGNEQIISMDANIEKCLDKYREQERDLILKIAVLHHHVNPIYPEFKRYGSVVDAVSIKKELSQLKFNLILHGHKHYPYYCEDSTFENGSSKSLTIISSGSMGGHQPTGVSHSFNILEVQNNYDDLPKIILNRKEFDSTGLFDRYQSKPFKKLIKLKSTQKSESEIAGESLSKILSGSVPINFCNKMFYTQSYYQNYNPIQVEHYYITYDIYWSGKELGDHSAHHVLNFKNLGREFLRGIFLSLSGTRITKYNDLNVKAKYTFKGKTYQIGQPDIKEDGYIKIVKFPFMGKGIPPDESAKIDVKYLWPNTVESPDEESEWGLENWLFRELINFTIKCEFKESGKFYKATGISAYYDADGFNYKLSPKTYLKIKKSGKMIEWTFSPERPQKSIHFIRCNFN